MRRLKPALAAVLVALGAVVPACGDSPPKPGGAFDEERAMRDVETQVEFGPRPAGSEANRLQVDFLVDRLRAAGAADVRVQRPHRNVVGTIPGRSEGSVVVGAHHDTKDAIPGFVGANDGASGVAVVLELARALPDRVDGSSVNIALFDAEEPRGGRPFEAAGARGSGQYVHYARRARQGAPPLDEIEAMVLFDLVGDCDLQIPREENSNPELYARFADAAGGAPFEGTAGPIGDDHLPFLEAGVPAVDIIDFTFGPGPSPGAWWHTGDDTLEKVCPASLDAVGEAAIEVVPAIGAGE